ncbi:hypothetical protein [Joostella sp.]|uniref:hypothetical protein n=1 Tax=Joostella sp. TaxID=2231138 RepID=UPI003A8E8FCA
MKTLEVVKEHFKNAKRVRCLARNVIFEIKKENRVFDVDIYTSNVWIEIYYLPSILLCRGKDNQLAEIIEEYPATSEQAIYDNSNNICDLIRQKFDEWVFGIETQAGEKLRVVDSKDFNEIITEIEKEIKNTKQL